MLRYLQGFIFFLLCFYNVSLLSLYYIKESLLTLFTAREGIMLKKITKRDKLFGEKIKRLSQDWFNFDPFLILHDRGYGTAEIQRQAL